MKNICLIQLTLLSALLFGCSHSPSDRSERTNVDVTLLKLKDMWKLEATEFRTSKVFWSQSVKILKELLKTSPPNVVEVEFRRICRTMLPEDAHNPDDLDESYDNALLEALIELSIEEKDSVRLGSLLMANCPSYVGLVPLEFRVATDWLDAFPSLCDWYSEAKSASAKKELAFCLARAFVSLRAQYSVDDSFVAQAKLWLKKNQFNVEVNYHYPHLVGSPVMERYRLGEQDLFVLKHRGP